MVCAKLLSLNEQALALLFAHENDCDYFGGRIDIKQYPILAEQAQLALRNRVRAQRFEVACFSQRVGCQAFHSGVEHKGERG